MFKCSRCGVEIGYGIEKQENGFFLLKKRSFFPNKGTISSSKRIDKYELNECDTADTAVQ